VGPGDIITQGARERAREEALGKGKASVIYNEIEA
jgi:hypothetical protein